MSTKLESDKTQNFKTRSRTILYTKHTEPEIHSCSQFLLIDFCEMDLLFGPMEQIQRHHTLLLLLLSFLCIFSRFTYQRLDPIKIRMAQTLQGAHSLIGCIDQQFPDTVHRTHLHIKHRHKDHAPRFALRFLVHSIHSVNDIELIQSRVHLLHLLLARPSQFEYDLPELVLIG